LNKIEKLAVQGILARDKEITERYVQPLRQDMQELFGEITARVGLEPDAIGKTHQLDFANFVIIPVPQPQPESTSPPRLEVVGSEDTDPEDTDPEDAGSGGY
jgi:hypothetical protein